MINQRKSAKKKKCKKIPKNALFTCKRVFLNLVFCLTCFNLDNLKYLHNLYFFAFFLQILHYFRKIMQYCCKIMQKIQFRFFLMMCLQSVLNLGYESKASLSIFGASIRHLTRRTRSFGSVRFVFKSLYILVGVLMVYFLGTLALALTFLRLVNSVSVSTLPTS